MCLLIVVSRTCAEAPLVVAANRDEYLARPSTAFTVLRSEDPRVVGGRDELAGGTWLAVNEHGVVAALTNRPNPAGRDATKRSRGQLPINLASCHTAADAASVAHSFDPRDFNPCWLMVGDPYRLFYIDLTGPERAEVSELGPGIHILENRPLGAASPKVDRVRALLSGVDLKKPRQRRHRLGALLADHAVAGGSVVSHPETPRSVGRQARACCVHAGPYATRSSSMVECAPGAPPALWVSGGPPCSDPFHELSTIWTR